VRTLSCYDCVRSSYTEHWHCHLLNCECLLDDDRHRSKRAADLLKDIKTGVCTVIVFPTCSCLFEANEMVEMWN
jgi:hypothetical protein